MQTANTCEEEIDGSIDLTSSPFESMKTKDARRYVTWIDMNDIEIFDSNEGGLISEKLIPLISCLL